jgi:putative ABC transport system permease protein
LEEQPDRVKEKYNLLREELLKHHEIESVTACFQLPGAAILDHALVKTEDDPDGQYIPLMVAGEDFLPFFRIPLIAGKDFSPSKFDYQTEFNIAYDFWRNQNISDHIEEYVINRKALSVLGFDTPEDAIGKILQIEQGGIGYFSKGVIVGVTDDFNYTGLYEETGSLIILQRNLFLHNIMVRLNPNDMMQARNVFESVWNEVNPDYPADYVFMNDILGNKYVNEINAQYLVYIFSLLCFIIADLGVIIFMAFIIRRRTKEIGIRKVHGANIGEVVKMLNMGFVQYVAFAFAIAIPVAWYVMNQWLQRFAYQTSLDWWIFALAGVSVLFISALSVSLQSLRAAMVNPVEAIKIE